MNDGTLLFVNFAAYSVLLLVPIIGIEAWELKRGLPVSIGRATAVSGLANVVSTLVGALAVLGTGWVLGSLDVIAEPQAGEGDVAVFIILVPCYFLSVWTQTLVGAPLLRRFSTDRVRAVFIRANLLGSAMIAIVPIARFVKSAVVNGRIIW